MKNNYVFTYGTLLKGERNHHLINDNDYVCDASVSGFEMFNLGRYPGIYHGDGIVNGEIYLVDDKTLKKLDELEEEGSLYIREEVIAKSDNQEYKVYIYVYNLEVANPEYIGNSPYSWKNRKYV